MFAVLLAIAFDSAGQINLPAAKPVPRMQVLPLPERPGQRRPRRKRNRPLLLCEETFTGRFSIRSSVPAAAR